MQAVDSDTNNQHRNSIWHQAKVCLSKCSRESAKSISWYFSSDLTAIFLFYFTLMFHLLLFLFWIDTKTSLENGKNDKVSMIVHDDQV